MQKNLDKLVLFSIDDSLWAMPLTEDSQFISCDGAVSIPGTSSDVEGLIYNSGRIITVLNAKKILGINHSKNKGNNCLLFYWQGNYYGLLVDEGTDVVDTKKILVDKKQKIFKEYININKQKIYILKPQDIWKAIKL